MQQSHGAPLPRATYAPNNHFLLAHTPMSPPVLRRNRSRKPPALAVTCRASPAEAKPPPPDQRQVPDVNTLFRRFWKVAAPYWFSDDKTQARLRLASVFALTLATTGISVGFNFLGRDFYNALASKFPDSSVS